MRHDPCRAHPRGGARSGRGVGRRWLLGVVPAAAALVTAAQAHAAVTIPELAVACDLTLGPALRAAGAAYRSATGVRVDVFAMDPGLILPQLERQVQNDILVTQRSMMDAAVQAGVVAKDAVHGGWTDPIVIAGRRDGSARNDHPIAVCDPTPACGMDSTDILARLGMVSEKTIGVIDTDSVVALVLHGSARAGLMHMTDVRAHPDLQVLRVVPASVQPPVSYAAAVTKLARRPDPGRFVDFLLANQATTLLASLGLESAS
jgi:molybdate transport system substrate-binding protein